MIRPSPFSTPIHALGLVALALGCFVNDDTSPPEDESSGTRSGPLTETETETDFDTGVETTGIVDGTTEIPEDTTSTSTGGTDTADTGGPPPSDGPDLDGDGIADLVVGARSYEDFTGAVWVGYGADLLTGGLGVADAVLTTDAVGSNLGLAGTVCDIDGDGHEDLVAGGLSGYAVWFGGTILATGAAPDLVVSGDLLVSVRALRCGDMTGDGLADVVSAAADFESWHLNVLAGDPGLRDETMIDFASWPGAVTVTGEGSQFFPPFAVGDVDGDGLLDALVGEPNAGVGGEVYVFLGATFPPGAPDVVLAGETPGGHYGRTLGIGDYTGDGVDEAAIGDDQGILIIDVQPDFEVVNFNRPGADANTGQFGAGGRFIFGVDEGLGDLTMFFTSTDQVGGDAVEVCAADLPMALGALGTLVDPAVSAAAASASFFTFSGPTDPATFLPAGPGGVLSVIEPARGDCTTVPVVAGVATLGPVADHAALELTEHWTHADAHNVVAFSVRKP